MGAWKSAKWGLGVLGWSFSAWGAPKDLGFFFPGIPLSAPSAVLGRSSPEYQTLINCRNATDKPATCNPAGQGRFFDLSSGPALQDPYNIVNRCIAIRGTGDLYDKGPVTLNATGPTVDCPAAPNEVVQAQLVACYERVNGVMCSLATACFEGANLTGQCTRDHPAEAILTLSP